MITDTRLLDMSRREADIFVSFFRPQGKRLSVKKIGEFKISLLRSSTYFDDASLSEDAEGSRDPRVHRFHRRAHHIKENRWLSDILRPAHTVFRSTSLVAQYVAVASGHGIAMLPSYVAAHNGSFAP